MTQYPSLDRAVADRDAIALETRTLLADGTATREQLEDVSNRLDEARAEVERQEAWKASMERVLSLPAEERARHLVDGTPRGPELMQRAEDPWSGDAARSFLHSSALQYRDRALNAIERSELTDDAKTLADNMIRSARETDTIGSQWAIVTTNPDYKRAVGKMFRDPVAGRARFSPEEHIAYDAAETVNRAMSEGTTTAGGFLVPAELDPSINIINNGTINPWRDISRVVQTTSYQWQPVTSAGISAEWTTESTEWADASPTIARPTIQTYKMDAYVQASFELVADSNITDEISPLINDAFDRLEANAFALGSGGGQPWGAITRVAAVSGARVAGSSGSAGAADLVAADIYAVDNALAARYSGNASWVAHKAFWNKVRQLATGSGQQAGSFWQDFGPGRPSTLLGHPVYECSEMDSSIVSGSNDEICLLGDFRQGYVIVDRVGVTAMFNPMVVGSNRRPTGEVGWAFYKRVGADVLDSTNVDFARLLRL